MCWFAIAISCYNTKASLKTPLSSPSINARQTKPFERYALDLFHVCSEPHLTAAMALASPCMIADCGKSYSNQSQTISHMKTHPELAGKNVRFFNRT